MQAGCKVLVLSLFAGGVGLISAGCGPKAASAITYDVPRGVAAPQRYSDQLWARVLRDFVRSGFVDYASLSKDRAALDGYYATVAATGPSGTPGQFPTDADKACYWINAYNALVVYSVVQRYPLDTVYDLALPRLEHQVLFTVDGQVRNLASLEAEILSLTGGDVRTIFALSRAARGTPRLAGEPYRGADLERQLAEAASDALSSPYLLRIDHATQSLFLWQRILRYEPEFEAFWERRRRVRAVRLFDVLSQMAGPQQRDLLRGAVGYTLRPIPFDRSLNELSSGLRVP